MHKAKKSQKYYIPHKSKHMEKIVDSFLSLKRGKVLDIPSGNLWLTKILIDNGFDCVADDICYINITEEMERFDIEYNSSNLDKALPYEKESFDYVICFAGLEHIANPYVAVKEFGRVLKKSGKLFVIIPNTLNFTSRLRFLINGSFSAFPHIMDTNEDYRHLHINPIFISQFNYVCSEIGLEIIQVRSFDAIKLFYRIITFLFLPLLFPIQRYFNRKFKNTHIKKVLNSKNVLLDKSFFLVIEKKMIKPDKKCIGDFGKYPSIGID